MAFCCFLGGAICFLRLLGSQKDDCPRVQSRTEEWTDSLERMGVTGKPDEMVISFGLETGLFLLWDDSFEEMHQQKTKPTLPHSP